jgi:uncharacterized protein YunC (DUF1805 family)
MPETRSSGWSGPVQLRCYCDKACDQCLTDLYPIRSFGNPHMSKVMPACDCSPLLVISDRDEVVMCFLLEVHAAEVTGEDHVDRARARGINGWNLAALQSLVHTGIRIVLGDDSDGQLVYEGRHRTSRQRNAHAI